MNMLLILVTIAMIGIMLTGIVFAGLIVVLCLAGCGIGCKEVNAHEGENRKGL